MSPRISLWLSRLGLLLAAGCLALGGWLGWADRPPTSMLRFTTPREFGAVAAAEDHFVEIAVTNAGRTAVRLAGLDGEEC